MWSRPTCSSSPRRGRSQCRRSPRPTRPLRALRGTGQRQSRWATGWSTRCAAAGWIPAFLLAAPGRVGLYFIEAGAGPRPSSITYDRVGSAFAEAAPETIDFAGALAGARLLHCGGITPALGPNGISLARAAQAAADAAGVPVCFDGNYRAQLWDAWDSKPREVLRDSCRRVDPDRQSPGHLAAARTEFPETGRIVDARPPWPRSTSSLGCS